jgi:hypothetical protein
VPPWPNPDAGKPWIKAGTKSDWDVPGAAAGAAFPGEGLHTVAVGVCSPDPQLNPDRGPPPGT